MYILPQVLVFQEFQQIPTAITEPLRAFITGPQYDLKRYIDEKDDIGLGQYDPTIDTAYLWPDRPAGGVVDQDWTSLYMDNAWLKYWSNPDVVQVNASRRNHIRAATSVFQTFRTWARSAAFYTRDVATGDGVRIRGTGSDLVDYDIETFVTGFEHESVAASIAAASADTDNQITELAVESITQSVGPHNNVAGVADGSAYDGLEDGYVSETYTVLVTQASAGGDATTGRLKITSASGTDNVLDITPAAFGSDTDIGTRGLVVAFNNSGTNSSSSSSPGGIVVDMNDFVEGQTWVVTVTQAFTATTPTSGGTYSGPSDTTYVATVTKGGAFADQPEVMISTTTGIDVSGPHIITGAATPIAIGNYGVTIAVDGQLCYGDRFYIESTAEQDGAVQTLVLAHSLSSVLDAVNLTVDLFIVKNMEVSENRTGHAPLVNFETTATQITVKSGIIGVDSTWVDGGTLMEMDAYKGDMYVQYRALLQTGCSAVGTIDDIGDVVSTLGPVVPENPLALGVYKALQNANGTEVKYMGVCSDDLAGYSAVADAIVGRDDVYSIVPLTQDATIQGLFQAHVNQMSTAENGRWRIAWLNSASSAEAGIVTLDSQGDPYLATVTDDPSTVGTQYTFVTWTGGTFLTDGVIAGDILRCNYSSDGFSNYTYEEYTVDAVISEDTMRLISGPSAAINVPSKFEVWRNLSKTQIATNYGAISAAFGDRRVRHIWPDWVGSAGTQMEGFYLCAALAGLRSGVAPHQGLTNVELVGFDDLERTTEYFGGSQLNIIAEAGTWIVTETPEGTVYTRQQLTTGDYDDLNEREDSIVTNVDSISYYLLGIFEPYIGKANVTPDFVTFLESQLDAAIETLKASGTDILGGQVLDGTEITEIRQHSLLRDRVVAQVNLDLPYPFNNFELHLVI